MDNELKPCPFCGGEAKLLWRYKKGTANRKNYWVACCACGTRMQGRKSLLKAISDWNSAMEDKT